jgi:cytidine deaminase
MADWEFKTVRYDGGKTILVDLSPKQQKRIQIYCEVLEKAKFSNVANPIFSNYFVKGSIGLSDGYGLKPAGNIEYGICQALHCEESAVAAFRSAHGRSTKKDDIILVILSGSPGAFASPCGNCRDIMLEDLGEDFEIICGAPEGGIAVVTKMKDYLVEDFKEITINNGPPSVDIHSFLEKLLKTVSAGEQLENDAYSPKEIHPERRYYALIATRYGDYIGARDVMCEYHPIYALKDAIRQARRVNDPYIDYVIIVCEDFGGGPPHVMYKDRQHLIELNLQQELLLDEERDPKVYLATHKQREIIRFWQTSIKEWLPFAFTPRNFGPEFIKRLEKYYQQK